MTDENKTTSYTLRPTKWEIYPNDQDYYQDLTTTIEIEDGGAGEFVKLSQELSGEGKISIDREEWPIVRKAIDTVFAEIAKNEHNSKKPA
ncbi:MAG: hypothetical protein KJO69_05325 [Gammaproteobacteria bacterium]|nr:hypothetical protein [Gammaproteobacteria bacterium]